MVLNLKERKKKTFDIVLLDGTELHIKKATEEQIIALKLVKIGGTQNTNGKKYFIHFRHKRDDGTYIRVTIVGVCENGFTLAFDSEKETVLDPVFSAQAGDSEGTLVYYSEQKKVESSQSVKEEN